MSKKNSNVKNKNPKAVETSKRPFPLIKTLNICVLIGLVFLLFYAPFFRGLYFNEEMATTFFYSGLLFLIFLIKRLIDKDFKIIKTWLDIVALLIVIVYAIPIVFGFFASAQGAWDKFLRYINYFLIYIICRDIIKEDKNIKVLLNAIIVSAVGVCLLGIDAGAGAGATNKINWVLQQIPVWLHLKAGAANLMTFKFFGGFEAERIYSTLQYPNVLASYLGAVFFLIAGLLMISDSYWKRAWYGAAGFIVFYTFILTGSRGMIVVLPVMALVLFISLWNKKLSLSFIVDAVIPAATGVLFSSMFGNFVNSGQYSKVWLTILAGIVISAVLTSLVQILKKFLINVSIKIYAGIAAAVIIVLAVLVGIALNIEKPLVIKHDASEANSAKVVIRDLTKIKPSTKYTLDFYVDSRSNSLKEDAYIVSVLSMDKFNNLEPLVAAAGKDEKASKTLTFTTKANTAILRLQMQNISRNTSASFSNFVLKEAEAGKTKRIIVQYKFLPTELVYRIQDISLQTHNAWERFVFVGDAFKIIAANPFGTGGGGWRATYHQYQSYEYSSNEVHNYPVQLWVETGFLGILVLIALIVLIIHHYVKIRIQGKKEEPENQEDFQRIILSGVIFTTILSLYAHSVIDFDFSLSAIPIVVWALTGIISGLYTMREGHQDIQIRMYKDEKKQNYTDAMIGINYATTVISIILMLILTAAGLNSINGRALIAKANAYESKFNSNKVLKKELAQVLPVLVPIYSDYLKLQPLDEKKRQRYIEYLNMYQMVGQNLDKEQISQLGRQLKENIELNVKNEPNSLDALSTMSSYSIATGNIEEGLAYADKVAVQGRFISEAYAAKGQLYIMAGETAIKKGKGNTAVECFKKAAGIKKEFEEAAKQSLKPITITTEFDEVVSQAEKMLGKK
ncbi:MAG: O-antigen ligase family protein [Ignavibacteriales bacterium]